MPQLRVVVTKDELALIKERAKQAGKSVSEWVRAVVLRAVAFGK